MAQTKVLFASLLGLAAIPALACAQQSPYPILNGQLQLNDVFTTLNVEMAKGHGIASTAAAAGNHLAARGVARDLSVTSQQKLSGYVGASSVITAGAATDVTLATAVASGNIAQVEVCCATTTYAVTQTVGQEQAINASSLILVGSADQVVATAQSTANNFASSTTDGETSGQIRHFNGSAINANAVVGGGQNNASLSSNAVTAANSARWDGETATIYANTRQRNEGAVSSNSAVDVQSGTNVTSAAAGAGNLAEVQNQWGYAQLKASQSNDHKVAATSSVYLGDWGGFSVSGANAIGNSALLSNVGSDATMDVGQSNTGQIGSLGFLEGNAARGGVGIVASSATGNAITGYACASCGSAGVKVEGYANQYNSGGVSAGGYVSVGSSGPMTASASAIGNSATFAAQKGL